MPNCVQLIDKKTEEPAALAKVDDEIREIFNAPADEKNWLFGWFNIIGLRLALGHSLKEIQAELLEQEDQELALVCQHLMDNYEPKAWREFK